MGMMIPPYLHNLPPEALSEALSRARRNPEIKAFRKELLIPLRDHFLRECGERSPSADDPTSLDRCRGAYQALADLENLIDTAS